MPENKALPNIKNPVQLKWGEVPQTKFKNHLSSINVTLMDAPSIDQLMSYIAPFSLATWEDKPKDNYSFIERNAAINDLFEGKLLPTAMETIGITFRLEYLDLVDVTHFLRHRSMSFSAHCTADRDMRHDDALIKPSIQDIRPFCERYIKIVEDAKQLYADMVDSEDVSILDARTILPRCLESHYYMRGNLKDIIALIRQRLDQQIQPMSDNIFALKMWILLVKQYPLLKPLIDVSAKDMWYINTASTGRNSNIYMPEEKNDVFEYNTQWFLYKKRRADFAGSSVFTLIKEKLLQELDSL